MKSVVQSHTRENRPAIQSIQEKNKNIVVQNNKREVTKLPSFSSSALLSQIKSFTSSVDHNYYLGFGGLGDGLILLASCWNDPRARIIFFANYQPLVKSFFDLFGLQSYLHDNVMGTRIANHVYDYVIKLPTFKQSAHLADGLDYGNWVDEVKYITRINSKVPWINHLGKEDYNKKVVVIAPSGSHRDLRRQRYLHPHECQALAKKYLEKDYEVFAVGSIGDLHFYGKVDHPNFHWLNSERIYHHNSDERSDLKRMLRIIHAAEEVFSMDTWLKTYSLLCEIPTTVIETRWEGRYRRYGDDVTDLIFLNPKIWPWIKFERIETLIS